MQKKYYASTVLNHNTTVYMHVYVNTFAIFDCVIQTLNIFLTNRTWTKVLVLIIDMLSPHVQTCSICTCTCKHFKILFIQKPEIAV